MSQCVVTLNLPDQAELTISLHLGICTMAQVKYGARLISWSLLQWTEIDPG